MREKAWWWKPVLSVRRLQGDQVDEQGWRMATQIGDVSTRSGDTSTKMTKYSETGDTTYKPDDGINQHNDGNVLHEFAFFY
jgi:hypothetical protein